MRLTVQIATKLNRSHLVNGEVAYLLPCLGRTERTCRRRGPQAVTMEDTFSCIHGSIGRRAPASEHLMSEPAIVAGIAKATLPANPKVKWDDWVADYCRVRDLIEETYPDISRLQRADVHAGRVLSRQRRARADLEDRERQGRVHHAADADLGRLRRRAGALPADHLRSNDQFNTTIYG